MKLDGYERELLLRAKMSISKEHILVDYSGSSSASGYGINSPFCYTEAYTFFGLKSIYINLFMNTPPTGAQHKREIFVV